MGRQNQVPSRGRTDTFGLARGDTSDFKNQSLGSTVRQGLDSQQVQVPTT